MSYYSASSLLKGLELRSLPQLQQVKLKVFVSKCRGMIHLDLSDCPI